MTLLDGLKRSQLPTAEKTTDNEARDLTQGFVSQVARMVTVHYAVRLLVPAPIRMVMTLWRATGFIRKKTRNALAGSLAVHVDQVWMVTQAGDVKVPLKDIRRGDRIRVQVGNMVPVDGTVLEGNAMVNESSMTGESMSVLRKEGHTVYAGTVVEEGSIVVEVIKLPSESRIQSVARMIDQSEQLKAGIQGKAERLADTIVPFSFVASLAPLVFTRNLTKAMSVLMVDYSCALKLSIPISVISAMREAAGRRMLVKGGKFLENFAPAALCIAVTKLV